ncbi:BNR repeat-containing protein [Candidatus Sodalis endolongispinus]|uniref:BNR repeat-containing protein n=1 Tax=Candidatus Sodalis endolongispinus TaxID=2812662 RepID=A0ABS5YD79_9GAMM|nr:BNR repeat-containing protein [Candidatus Sodalis endolongispinus]MBT9432903.1 BNR repeat-containing protein [Candidatus Sodalis endolongispinus]
MKHEVIHSLVGEACADFTVLFCLVTHEEYLFAAWYDPRHRITVWCRPPSSEAWTTLQPEGFWIAKRNRNANITDYDSHNYLTMAIDDEGLIHLSGNMHADPLIYYRSAKPLDIASLRPVRSMVGEREERTTYPLFFKYEKGLLLFRYRYRDGCSGNGDDIYNCWDSKTQTWRRLLDTPLLNGEGERNGYARPPVPGPDGYWHMIWMWRETPDCETNNNLSYARSQDLLHWETSSGETLDLAPPSPYSFCILS